MKKIKNQLRVLFDVDKTLVRDLKINECKSKALSFIYYGMHKYQVPIMSNIELLIAYKKRGYEGTVHTANGVDWAEEVVKKLELVEYVDYVGTKYITYVDDRDANDWMIRVYVPE